MMDLVDQVGALVHLAGGQIVGKTRLHKIAYLLEAKTLGLGLDFDYHNYGPFSPELAYAVDDAEALEYLRTEERPGFHSVPYKIFNSTDKTPEFENDAISGARKIALDAMAGYSALVLELAATAVYLKQNGYAKNYWNEVKKRKSVKASGQALKLAKDLIADLEL